MKREEHLSGEKIPNDPADRIETYMDRLEDVFLNSDERVRERNLDFLRPKLHDALLIKRDNFPESYFELQQRIARERGQPVERIPENIRAQMIDTAIEDQRHSLDAWVDYLSSDDAVYPTWFKYLAWNNIIKLSQFDKERGEFKKRTDSTVAPFPDIYREPLAQMADIYEKIKADNKQLSEPEVRRAFEKKFPALYAELIQKSLAAQIESKEQTAGEWVKYEQGEAGAAEKLYQSLEEKGTGWCTAGRSTAETQVERGDFYVYYTYDSSGTPTQPRLAIRMDGHDKIGEVRGVLPHQNVEPLMQNVLDEKLSTFGPEADNYRKKSEDMRKLTEIDGKCFKRDPSTGSVVELRQLSLTKAELVFIYELSSKIEGFGYGDDPRIAEIRKHRNPKEDIPILLGYAPSEVAWQQEDINDHTHVYIGPLFEGIFQRSIDHIYGRVPVIDKRIELFSSEEIKQMPIEIGGLHKDQLTTELKGHDVDIEKRAAEILDSASFSPLQETKKINLVILTCEDLGISGPDGITSTKNIFKRAAAIGLHLCPAEVGPRLLLEGYPPDGRVAFIAMKPLSDEKGDSCLLTVQNSRDSVRQNGEVITRLELGARDALEDSEESEWAYHLRFVFCLPN